MDGIKNWFTRTFHWLFDPVDEPEVEDGAEGSESLTNPTLPSSPLNPLH